MFKRRFVNGRKTSLTSFALVLVCLFSFSLFMGCTGSDTFIIQNTKLSKLFDANIVGQQGLVPFISVDGNALEVQSGFDFNSDTNTLRTGCVELGDGNSYCASTDFPNPDLSDFVPYTGATRNVDLGSNDLVLDGSIGIGDDEPPYDLTLEESKEFVVLMRPVVINSLTEVAGAGTDLNAGTYYIRVGQADKLLNGTYGLTKMVEQSITISAGSSININVTTPLFITNGWQVFHVGTEPNMTRPEYTWLVYGGGSQTFTNNFDGTQGKANGYDYFGGNAKASYISSENVWLTTELFETGVGRFRYPGRSARATILELGPTSTAVTTGDSYFISIGSGGYFARMGMQFRAGGGSYKRNDLVFEVNPSGVVGSTEVFRMEYTKNILIPNDNAELIFGTGRDASIYYDGTNLRVNPKKVGSGVVYVDGNVSAEGFVTRTSVYDKSKGSALDKIKDSGELVDVKGDIDHSKFYGYTPIEVTDFDKPEVRLVESDTCGLKEAETGIVDEKCVNDFVEETYYPNKKIVGGVNIVDEIELLRQGIVELKSIISVMQTSLINTINRVTGAETKITVLESENALIKSELCSKDASYSWCKSVKE
jgi:hypothetical protein